MRGAATALIAMALGGAACLRAEIIDRIAVSVGNRVITNAQIEREARITAFLNNEPPDLSAAGRRKTADRLVEQLLVRRELEAARYPAVPQSDADPMLKEITARYKTAAEFRGALAQHGIAETELREHLLWQVSFLRFIDIRFRPGVQVSDQEVRDYFDKTIRPAAAGADPKHAPTLDEYRDRIEETLTGQRVDQDLDRWLEAARRRTPVEYRQGAFR
jgi:hypothetical protein